MLTGAADVVDVATAPGSIAVVVLGVVWQFLKYADAKLDAQDHTWRSDRDRLEAIAEELRVELTDARLELSAERVAHSITATKLALAQRRIE